MSQKLLTESMSAELMKEVDMTSSPSTLAETIPVVDISTIPNGITNISKRPYRFIN